MDNREKLAELLEEARLKYHVRIKEFPDKYNTIEWHDYFADYLIANGVVVQEWIPVSEPPPLFCAVSGYCPEQNNIYEVYLNARGEWHFFDKTVAGALLDESITHWSHLPPPPKGE